MKSGSRKNISIREEIILDSYEKIRKFMEVLDISPNNKEDLTQIIIEKVYSEMFKSFIDQITMDQDITSQIYLEKLNANIDIIILSNLMDYKKNYCKALDLYSEQNEKLR